MEYKLPPLPNPDMTQQFSGFVMPANVVEYFTRNQMQEYAEQAVAPLLVEIERLEKALDARIPDRWK